MYPTLPRSQAWLSNGTPQVGAVPPYASLLCGKLVAMPATSSEVQHAFERKYRGQQSRISRHLFDGRLALLTTTSALGRSSLYNRLTFDGPVTPAAPTITKTAATATSKAITLGRPSATAKPM
jgi:Domain of unknown function (DUF4338)